MMIRPELFILPLLAVVVFFGDYWINAVSGACARKTAVHEASWWGGSFFLIGALNGLFMMGW